ncbi:small-conductance mechanosensitive channel protein MscY [Clostridium sediminicola]|uniref:mechanosensitive ion channel family protein n=1 Tax=Clostridium sediminicola TaxID=3114879 RepID=UPI0031F24DCD
MNEIKKSLYDNINFFDSFSKYVPSFILRTIIVTLAIFILFLILRKIFTKYIFRISIKLTLKTKTNLDEKLLHAFEKPMKSSFIVIGIFFSLKYFTSEFGLTMAKIYISIFRSIFIGLFSWGLHNLTNEDSILYENLKEKFSLNIDKTLYTFLAKIIRFIIVTLSLCVIAEEFGFNVNGFITGLGIGGLAVALAAKDTLGNIFGGFAIIMDKPFSIGDWIKADSVEGTVEDITFRSTKIRTFANAIVTVPNSKLSNESITNWAKMQKRRITFNIGITYDTPIDKIQVCIKRIKKMLQEHPDIHPETIFVNFDKFNTSSLDIFLYFFTNTTNWSKFLKVKEDINFRIMKILQEENVNIAFPSRSLYIEKS